MRAGHVRAASTFGALLDTVFWGRCLGVSRELGDQEDRVAFKGSKRVLIVEDRREIARSFARTLRSCGHEATVTLTLKDAENALAEARFDIILLDLVLDDGDGEDLLETVEQLVPRPAVAVVSGNLDSRRMTGLCGRVAATLPKPVPAGALRMLVDRLSARSAEGNNPVEWFCREYGLSRKETELVLAITSGLSNQEAAESLSCKRGTVSTYWSRIFDKTGCHSRQEVIGALFRFLFEYWGLHR